MGDKAEGGAKNHKISQKTGDLIYGWTLMTSEKLHKKILKEEKMPTTDSTVTDCIQLQHHPQLYSE